MRLTFEQFSEILAEVLEQHISRDTTVDARDQQWENDNAAKTLALRLRENNVHLPHPEHE